VAGVGVKRGGGVPVGVSEIIGASVVRGAQYERMINPQIITRWGINLNIRSIADSQTNRIQVSPESYLIL
jgi:hypothetical protein